MTHPLVNIQIDIDIQNHADDGGEYQLRRADEYDEIRQHYRQQTGRTTAQALPDDSVIVLALMPDGEPITARYYSDDDSWMSVECFEKLNTPLFWWPIPAIPESIQAIIAHIANTEEEDLPF